MGKSAGSPPDPVATAQAQGSVNADTARLQAQLNRGDTFTPFGAVTNTDLGAQWANEELGRRRTAWEQGGGAQYRDVQLPEYGGGTDENGNQQLIGYRTERQLIPGSGFDEVAARQAIDASNPHKDQWRQIMSLSPEQQGLYNQEVALEAGSNALAMEMLPQARSALMAPMATDDADARDRATAGIMSRLEPQFERDRTAMDSRLIAQGFNPNSVAYQGAADELSRARTDARMQAITAGSQESRDAAGFSNQQRAQRLQELGMLFGLGPGVQLPQAGGTASAGVSPADLMGMTQAGYNAKAQQAASGNSAAAGLAGAAAMAAATAI